MIISDHADDFALELLRDGTSRVAFLLDDQMPSLDAVLQALRARRLGQSVLDPSLVDAIIEHGGGPTAGSFTAPEIEVMEQMAQALSSRAVAAALHLSVKSVEKRRIPAHPGQPIRSAPQRQGSQPACPCSLGRPRDPDLCANHPGEAF
jgi:DNA-binding NarL/FixJ family response regulator